MMFSFTIHVFFYQVKMLMFYNMQFDIFGIKQDLQYIVIALRNFN